MGVLSHTAGMIGRREVLRSGIVEHQKRADLTINLIAGKEIPHGKSIADHMGRAWLIDAEDILVRGGLNCRMTGHGFPPSGRHWLRLAVTLIDTSPQNSTVPSLSQTSTSAPAVPSAVTFRAPAEVRRTASPALR